ncbi:hypothetical protein GW750_09265 [bacterium]|nr:hypothetical protein [bacterium]
MEDIQKVETNFDYGTYDLMIFCDFTPYSRIRTITQEHTDYFDKQKIIIIDHHVADTSPNTVLTIRDTDSIATCEMLTDIILQNRPKLLDANIATYLYL